MYDDAICDNHYGIDCYHEISPEIDYQTLVDGRAMNDKLTSNTNLATKQRLQHNEQFQQFRNF